MEKITCKHCGTKYSADVAKCPVCGASNLPSVTEDFEFLDDEFEAKPSTEAQEEKEEAPEESAPAEAAQPEGAPTSDTGRYNWEEIIAEIHGQKEDAAPEQAPAVPEAPKEAPAVQAAKPEQPENTEAPRERTRPDRPRKSKGSAGKTIAIVVIVAAVLAAAVFGLKSLGVFEKKTVEQEAPTLPVTETQEVVCTAITLSETEATLNAAGETMTLEAALQPVGCTDKVNWVSSDPSVATVDEAGTVTAVSEGKVNILASCGEYAATCMVTCSFEETTAESEETTTNGGALALSATDITMTYPGELARLYVENGEDKTITWSTDNETILSVDDSGLITAKATGTAHVYAEVDGEKLECIVRSNLGGEEGQPINVSLNKTDISMFNVGESFQLAVQYQENAPETTVAYEWSSSDDKVCTVDATGVVTAVGNGTAYISTTADGINLKCIVRINIAKTSG